MKNQKGASSVLVLLVLLLLVFLGVLAIVTSGSNLRLAEKSAETVKAWYRMDAQAEIQMSDAVRRVQTAYGEAKAYVEGRRFLDDAQQVIPEKALSEVRESWRNLTSDSEREAFLARLFPNVHLKMSDSALRDMMMEGVEIQTGTAPMSGAEYLADVSEGIQGTMLRMTLSDPEKRSTGTLEVMAQVLPAKLEEPGGHMRILQWKLVQPPFTYKNGIKLWEGIVK